MRIFIRPEFRVTDEGNGGGIRRVVEAQIKYLPEFIEDIEFTRDIKEADVLALHGGDYFKPSQGQYFASHCHGLYWDEYTWNKWEYELNHNVLKCIKQADVVTAPSEWVANTIRRALMRSVQVVPNGIDPDLWVPGDSNLEYVLWNKSRIDPICEIDSLINLAQLDQQHKYVSTLGPKSNTPSNLSVVGLQPYEGSLTLVQNAGVYLCTTRETFGIGTLEALSCGVPVVGWYWGGQREIIQHKVHGWLCAPGDIEGLREGVAWCLEHRDSLSNQCRELAQQYAWPKIIQQYASIYNGRSSSSSDHVRCSIVIPSYNLGRFMGDAINSALEQKCDGDFEVIVVDDNSTDGSYEAAKVYTRAKGGQRLRVIQTPSNQYLAGALNYGISQARGDYIMCLDADNILPENTLNVLSSILDTDRSLDIVYGRVQFITEDGAIDTAVSPDGISVWPPIDFGLKDQLEHKNQVPSTCLYRKRVWSTIGGYRRRCRTAEDADFWCRAGLAGFSPKRVSNMVTLIYRNRAEGMSRVNPDWPWEAWYSSVRVGSTALTGKIITNEPTQISVIIPVGPHHLNKYQDALDSIYNQQFKNWECILVNDSGQKLPWIPAWVKYRETTGSLGASVARNAGLEIASAKMFVPLDADDYLTPDALDKMWKVHKIHGGYVYTDYILAPEGRRVKVGSDACSKIQEVMPHPITGLYPMQAWHDAGGFNELLKVGEDWDFVANVTAQGYCGTYIPEPLVYYRVNDGGNRGAMITNHAELYKDIQAKYGGEDVACGCRKGGGATAFQQQAVAEAQRIVSAGGVPSNNDLVKIEMIAPDVYNQKFNGRVTGIQYTFSSSGVRQAQYVDRDDAKWFVEHLANQFRYADVADKSLVGVAD